MSDDINISETAHKQNDSIHTLRVSSLFKSFGHKNVVKGIEFQMQTGEVLGLLGPNGAGKTTTFYMIVGFHQPTAGDIFLDDEQITPLPMYKRARKGISYLPQEPSVFKKLTVEENIWSILETRKDLSKAEKNSVWKNSLKSSRLGVSENNMHSLFLGVNAEEQKSPALLPSNQNSYCWMNHLQELTLSPLPTLNT